MRGPGRRRAGRRRAGGRRYAGRDGDHHPYPRGTARPGRDLAAAERQARAAAPPADGDGGIDWDAASPEAQRDWLRRYVAKVIIRPNRPGVPRHWFDPLATVEVIPGPWWTGTRQPAARPPRPVRPPAAPPRSCDLPGCGHVHEANGLCHLHNRRQWEAAPRRAPGRLGPLPAPHRGRPAPGTPPRSCDLPGCGRPHEARGLCNGHGQRAKAAEPGRAPRGLGSFADPAAEAPAGGITADTRTKPSGPPYPGPDGFRAPIAAPASCCPGGPACATIPGPARRRHHHFTREQLEAYAAYWGLPGYGACTDPATLRSAAEVQVDPSNAGSPPSAKPPRMPGRTPPDPSPGV